MWWYQSAILEQSDQQFQLHELWDKSNLKLTFVGVLCSNVYILYIPGIIQSNDQGFEWLCAIYHAKIRPFSNILLNILIVRPSFKNLTCTGSSGRLMTNEIHEECHTKIDMLKV